MLVFVYGTLKTGLPNHFLLKDENNGKGTFVTNGTTVDRFPLIVATKFGIPMLLNQPGSGEVSMASFCIEYAMNLTAHGLCVCLIITIKF